MLKRYCNCILGSEQKKMIGDDVVIVNGFRYPTTRVTSAEIGQSDTADGLMSM